MRERQVREEAFLALGRHRLEQTFGGKQHVADRDDHAFRIAGRARGVDQCVGVGRWRWLVTSERLGGAHQVVPLMIAVADPLVRKADPDRAFGKGGNEFIGIRHWPEAECPGVRMVWVELDERRKSWW